jgi:hypothetical protein
LEYGVCAASLAGLPDAPDQMRLGMAVQQQQRRSGAPFHSENIDIAHGNAKGREILEGHGVSLVI